MTHEPRPLILSLDTLEAICQKQVTLDESICASRGITADEFAHDLHSKRMDPTKTLAAWSLILEQLGYTEEDILNMYEQKNSTNYVRIAEGY